MMRAAQVFEVAERASECALVEKVWSARSTPATSFLSVAESHWQIVVTTHLGRTGVVLQGPNDAARVTPIPEGAEFFGIVLRLGAFMPAVSLAHLVGTADLRPNVGKRGSWLDGNRWEVPTPDNADVFARRLVRQELLVEDRLVTRALADGDEGGSLRTAQRRVRRATGLTQTVIRQIARAHRAVDALGRGETPSGVASRLGYSDQPHLTRSLRRFIGQTPSQVLGTGAHWSASSAVRAHTNRSVVSVQDETPRPSLRSRRQDLPSEQAGMGRHAGVADHR